MPDHGHARVPPSANSKQIELVAARLAQRKFESLTIDRDHSHSFPAVTAARILAIPHCCFRSPDRRSSHLAGLLVERHSACPRQLAAMGIQATP
jgi:hypothetical protein